MIDYERLKELLEACKGQDDMNKFAQAVGSLFEECTIETIAAMVEERGQLKAENDALRKDTSIQDLLCCNLCRCAIQPANLLQVEFDRLKLDIEDLSKDADRREWEGYNNGLTLAGNLRPSIRYGDDGGRVLNDIRRQIDAAMHEELKS